MVIIYNVKDTMYVPVTYINVVKKLSHNRIIRTIKVCRHQQGKLLFSKAITVQDKISINIPVSEIDILYYNVTFL